MYSFDNRSDCISLLVAGVITCLFFFYGGKAYDEEVNKNAIINTELMKVINSVRTDCKKIDKTKRYDEYGKFKVTENYECQDGVIYSFIIP